MICLMAVKQGHVLDHRVLNGLAIQSVPIDLMLSTCPPVHNERVRECSINRSRNELQRLASGVTDELVLLLDSDVVMTEPDTVRLMVAAMEDPSIGCVAVNTKESYNDNHVVTACAVIRTSVYMDLDYTSAPTVCQCSLIAMKCKTVYVHVISAHELRDEKLDLTINTTRST